MSVPLYDSRFDFNESWLSEMPMGLGMAPANNGLYDRIVYNIGEMVDAGAPVISVSDDLKKIDGALVKYYWYQTGDVITLAVELSVKNQSLVVNNIGKHPGYIGKPPRASDLYDAILADNDKSIRIMSDSLLSDQGYSLWKKLFALGHRISVYDTDNPGTSFQTFADASEMDQFFKKSDHKFKRYQYVLSESTKFTDTLSVFLTRRMRELSGLL